MRIDTETRFIEVTPTISTTIYAAGDLIGGKLQFTQPIFQNVNDSGLIVSARLSDLSAQLAEIDLILFDSDPSGTTFTDNGAFDIADADLPKVCACIKFSASDYFNFVDNAVAYLGSISIPFRVNGGVPASTSATNVLYGALVSRGTPTYATTSEIRIQIAVNCD